jgi:3',5'-cyclic AMP phosphodiesterase CpdA
MFVLAHLSDPHIPPLPRPRLVDLAGKRLLGFVNWGLRRKALHQAEVLAAVVADLKAARPDHVVVTGDLANIALAAEFAPARAWLDRLGDPRDVTVIPGNHDAYVRSTAAHAMQHWAPYMRGDDGSQSSDFPFVRRRGPLALIALSSALPTGLFMATGRLGRAQLSRLAGHLARLAGEGAFRVVLIHHPPAGTRPWHKRLTDAKALLEVLRAHGAELVLHGHDHCRSVVDIAGPSASIPVVGVSSASAHEHDPAGYNLYRIDGSVGRWRCEMVARGHACGTRFVDLDRRMLIG